MDAALERYRSVFRRRLALHHMQIADYSTGRAMRLNERVMFRAAAADPFVATAVEEVASRRRPMMRLLDPRLTARLIRRAPTSVPTPLPQAAR
jgi:hypothetical protein